MQKCNKKIRYNKRDSGINVKKPKAAGVVTINVNKYVDILLIYC